MCVCLSINRTKLLKFRRSNKEKREREIKIEGEKEREVEKEREGESIEEGGRDREAQHSCVKRGEGQIEGVWGLPSRSCCCSIKRVNADLKALLS